VIVRTALVAVLCAAGCSRAAPEVHSTEVEAPPPAPSFAPPPPPLVQAPGSSAVVEASVPGVDAGDACRRLALDQGGTLEGLSFEGTVGLATGHDPEQGDGSYGVLVLDVPVCGAYALPPQRELLLGVLGGKAKWEALAAQWNGRRVRVTGDLRSLDVYIRPLRHFLLFAARVDPAP
jgi:hypothetical protein